MEEEELICVYCEKEAEGEYSIHRDGFCEGPEVPLCNDCGGSEYPSCPEIWEVIAIDLTENEKAVKEIVE